MRYLETHLYYVSPLFAGIAFLTALTIFRTKDSPKYLRAFAFFLLINFITDTIGAITADLTVNNITFVNLVTVFDFAFYIYFLRELIRSKKIKRFLFYTLLIYPPVCLVNILVVQAVTFHSMTYGLGCLLIIISCVYYFWEMFQNAYSVNLARQPSFWICSGLLFYYTCTFPVYGAVNLLLALPKVILRNLLFILVLLNILEYLSFTIAFLCRHKGKSMSSL